MADFFFYFLVKGLDSLVGYDLLSVFKSAVYSGWGSADSLFHTYLCCKKKITQHKKTHKKTYHINVF